MSDHVLVELYHEQQYKQPELCVPCSFSPTQLRFKQHDAEKIGEGKFGTVFKGTYFTQKVAVKVIHIAQKNSIYDIWNEVKVLSELGHHDNIIPFMGAYVHEQCCFIVTPFISNGNIRRFIQTNYNTLSAKIKVQLALQIAEGMEYVHARGILHRDLTSLNVLIGHPLCAKVIDFGLACKLESRDASSHWGNLAWMPPELVSRSSKHTKNTDVYSYGMILWELCSGKLPFAGIDGKDALQKIISNNEIAQHNSMPQTPEILSDIINQCWQHHDERPDFSKIVLMLNDVQMSDENLASNKSKTVSNNGGAINITHAHNATLQKLEISNCETTGNGGAVNVEHTQNATFQELGIRNCTAEGDGGAVNVEHTQKATLQKIDISNCNAKGDGGAINMKHTKNVTLQKVDIRNCTAEGNGGAGNIKDAENATFQAVNADGCFSNQNGGAFNLINVQNVEFNGCSFRNCVSKLNGGVACITNATNVTAGDLHKYIDCKRTACVNDHPKNSFIQFFIKQLPYSVLKSDIDEQLLFTVGFTSIVSLHKIKFVASDFSCGPKEIKLYVNNLQLSDFDTAQLTKSTQEFVLSANDLKEDTQALQLDCQMFRRTDTITVFVKSNQSDTQQTVINKLLILGQKS